MRQNGPNCYSRITTPSLQERTDASEAGPASKWSLRELSEGTRQAQIREECLDSHLLSKLATSFAVYVCNWEEEGSGVAKKGTAGGES
jgi:hypothetical protein